MRLIPIRRISEGRLITESDKTPLLPILVFSKIVTVCFVVLFIF